MKTHRRFWLLLLLFIVGVLVYQTSLPVLEGNDEFNHFNYVNWLRRENRLPDRTDPITSGIWQETGQPPLTYWLTASFLNLFNRPVYPGDIMREVDDVRNRWSLSVERWRRTDNLNLFYHGDGEAAFRHPDVVDTTRAARFLSLVWAVIAVIGAYGAANEVFEQESWALTATALFAFTPLMIYLGTYLSNDTGAIALSTLVTWLTLRMQRRGATPGRLILIGLLLGLAALAKVNALLIAPGVGLALLFDWRNRRQSFGRLIANGLLIGFMVTIFFGPWVLYGFTTYRDPFGFEKYSLLESTGAPAPTVWQLLSTTPETFASYWAKFGQAQAWMTPINYVLFGVVVLMSIAGYGWAIVARRYVNGRSLRVQQVCVLALMALMLFIGMVQWLIRLFTARSTFTGRLMYPAHAAIAILLTLGIQLLVSRLPRRYGRAARVFVVGSVVAIGLLVAPITLRAIYAPPVMLTHQQLPRLQGSPVDYDHTIRFLGYVQDDPAIHTDTFAPLTLCWEVLQVPTREAAYAVKIFDEKGRSVGERTSVHGTGRYYSTLWKPGDSFCETIDVYIRGTLSPGQTYNVLLTMLDARTYAVDWQATAADGTPIKLPFVAQVVSPAGKMTLDGESRPTTIRFPDFADLQAVRLDGNLSPGSSVKLALLWNVRAPVHENLSMFIHLIGPDTALVLADGIPRSGLYPTWAWSAGEQVADTWQIALPATLKPGRYTVELGFYRADSGERLAVSQDGLSIPDRIASLVDFEVR